MYEDETYIQCMCFGEILHVSRDRDSGDIYFAAYAPRMCGKIPWKHRLQHIWRIMTVGYPWQDDIIMRKEDAVQFAEWLLDSNGNTHTNPNEVR